MPERRRVQPLDRRTHHSHQLHIRRRGLSCAAEANVPGAGVISDFSGHPASRPGGGGRSADQRGARVADKGRGDGSQLIGGGCCPSEARR